MKAPLLTVVLALAMLQAPPTPPQGGQRGQAPSPQTPPAPLSAAECKCSIEVTVKHPNGEAISDVEITVTMSATRPVIQVDATGLPQVSRVPATPDTTVPAVLTATTDNAGRAVFRNLAEGTYTIQARREGYFSPLATNTFLAPQAPVPFTAQASESVSVGPLFNPPGARAAVPATIRQPVQQVTLNMVQGATIAGRVLDANRRPASAIQIGAYRVIWQFGHRTLSQVGNAVQTDDRGEYRLFWLPPGEYYIRTVAARALLPANGGTNFPSVTYYPGTRDPKSATPVVVPEGNERTGIDIAIQSVTGVTISGTIVNTIPGGTVGPRGQVNRTVTSVYLVPRNSVFFENPMLLPNTGGGARGARGGIAPSDSETPFEIRGVPPGTYDFYPVFNDGTPSGAGGATLPGYHTGRTPIEVGTENVSGIQSVIRPGTDLKGHVTITGTPPPSLPNRPVQPFTLANVRFQFQPKDNIPSLARAGVAALTSIDSDGVFTMVNLVEGQYVIAGVLGLPADAYVSEIRQDSRSVYDDAVVTIGKESQASLEVTITRGGGMIQGTVQDAKHNPVASSRITLVPDLPRRQNLMLYKTATSNAMGAFNMNGIAPGIYKLFAWEQNPAGAEQDPDFIRDYDVLATSVNVSVGLATAGLQVTQIPGKH